MRKLNLQHSVDVGLRSQQWEDNYNKVWAFVTENHRGPSRHHIEEHRMLNWMKFNRRKLNANAMDSVRKERFLCLQELIRSFHRVNQYE